ncbi:unnamed protein product [Haemonchus placei]|uniref:WH2 domain-containing protein n=1 Tax=Haemonchus placei TaxID=6290 RepID=A0A0N4W4J8_HAEPC|nr:unnamed protein product [Haemonchus placei]
MNDNPVKDKAKSQIPKTPVNALSAQGDPVPPKSINRISIMTELIKLKQTARQNDEKRSGWGETRLQRLMISSGPAFNIITFW